LVLATPPAPPQFLGPSQPPQPHLWTGSLDRPQPLADSWPCGSWLRLDGGWTASCLNSQVQTCPSHSLYLRPGCVAQAGCPSSLPLWRQWLAVAAQTAWCRTGRLYFGGLVLPHCPWPLLYLVVCLVGRWTPCPDIWTCGNGQLAQPPPIPLPQAYPGPWRTGRTLPWTYP
jgi:hypothetical protein